MAVASSRKSSGVGGRPTPNVGDCDASGIDAASNNTTPTMALHLHIRHRSVIVDFPELHPVEVIAGIRSAHSDQLLARGLNITGFVGRARCDDRFAAVKTPGQPETCERYGQPRLVEFRVQPGFSSVGRDL